MAQVLRESFEFWSRVFVLTDKYLRQSEQWKGIGLRLTLSRTFRLPQCGQAMPFGQRRSMNQSSACFSLEKLCITCTSDMPFR